MMSNHRFSWITCIIFALTVILALNSSAPVHAQTVGGTILGSVQDQQGAVIGKAVITARNLETGAIRETTAEDNGNYRISSIPAGSYEVSSSASGFKTEVRTNVAVTVGGDVTLNFALTIGAVSEKVEVAAEAPQVDTSSSALGGFVNSTTIRELPLNGRDWLQLALLQPGAVLTTGQNNTDARRQPGGYGLSISISGGRPTENAFRIDGLIVNDYANNGPGSALRVNMGVDAIREFSVLTNSYSAEYGRSSGGVVNAITKSGTNSFHGSAYEFVRNSAFDARNFFDGRDIPAFRRNQYGGSVGGPIKTDKTFFFVNYERLGELKSLTSSVGTLSENARNGMLCANAACTQTTRIAVSPKIVPYLTLYPLPNGQVTGDTGIFASPQPRLGHENYVIGKVDHYFSPVTNLFVSYNFDKAEVTVPDAFNVKVSAFRTPRQNAVLGLQHLFSPSLINIARVGVTRTYASGNIDVKALNPAINDPALGFLPGLNLGTFIIPGVSGAPIGYGAGGRGGLSSFGFTSPQISDDLSWTKGRQNLRMGFSFSRILYNENAPNLPQGQWTFTSIQNFLQGLPTSFQTDFPSTNVVRGERMSIIGAYVQDDFRVTSNLTLNLGVRYEMGTVIKEVNGLLANLRNITDPTTTIGDPYYNNATLKNFAPRIGFAWDPFKDGKTAIRGGVGMFDVIPQPYLFENKLPRADPFYLGATITNPPAASFPNQTLPLLTLTSLRSTNIEFHPSRTYKGQWNLNVQRQLTSSLALTVGYVGSSGVHLQHDLTDADQVPPSFVTWNGANLIFPIPGPGQKPQRINPNYGRITQQTWSGHSSYHALQVNLVQRPIKGLSYQLAYTWSKSIDDGSTSLTDTEGTNSVANAWAYIPNRGVSDFDVPHNLVANFLYELPVPGTVKTSHVANAILGGWQVGGIYTRQSGSPFTLTVAADTAFTGNSRFIDGSRPNFVAAPGCSPNAVTDDIDNYIMTQCFAFPAPGVLGNLGRNTLRMRPFRDLDFSLFKNQSLWGEKLKAQFRVEVFNILNNTNLQALTLQIFDGKGALIPTVGIAQGGTVNTSRQLQLGLRLLF